MKISIKQLKALIKEQMEESWSDKDSFLDMPSLRDKRAVKELDIAITADRDDVGEITYTVVSSTGGLAGFSKEELMAHISNEIDMLVTEDI